MANQVLAHQTDFSLALGGPLYQLYLRMRLARPPLELVPRRIIVICLICWAPLFFLALAAGQVTGGVSVPFLTNIGVHTRFLVALPLLIGAEPFVHERMKAIAEQFLARRLIRSEDRAQFEAIVGSATRLRNSTVAELSILMLAFAMGYWAWKGNVALGLSSWYAVNDRGSSRLTAAGVWYAFVSLPILRLMLLRWYFRLFIWYRFLWQLRSLPLHLNLFHPDRAGGLGFLAGSVDAFAPVLVPQAVMLAGIIGDQIWHTGAHLPNFKLEIIAVLVFLMLSVLAPLSFFAIRLDKAHRLASREFGILSSHYVDDFHRKWVDKGVASAESLLGTPDIQSLSDLGNAYEVIDRMRLLPFGRETVLRLTILLVVPLLPLVFTMVPFDELVKRLIRLVF